MGSNVGSAGRNTGAPSEIDRLGGPTESNNVRLGCGIGDSAINGMSGRSEVAAVVCAHDTWFGLWWVATDDDGVVFALCGIAIDETDGTTTPTAEVDGP